MNAYEMFDEIKDNIGRDEVGPSGHWTEVAILRKMNKGQRKAYSLITQTFGDWFVKKETLTPVASVITLPADCAKPVYLEEVSSGDEIPINTTVRERRESRVTSLTLESGGFNAYLLEGSIEINQSSYSNNVYLWYERRVPDLHFGTAPAGAATSLTLEDGKQESLIDDYYNGMTIEIVSGTGAGSRVAVSDYVGSTRILTLDSGTFAEDSIYGLVSVLPEEASDFIILDATLGLLAKPSSALDPKYFDFFSQERRKAENALEDWASVRLKNSNRVRHRGYAGDFYG